MSATSERLRVARSHSADGRAEIVLDWLIRFRWGAVAAQLAILVTAGALLSPQLPMGWLLALVGLLATSNLILAFARSQASASLLCGCALSFDILQLSALLHATGGAHNPFSVMYLVHIALSAVVLGTRWTWFLSALSVACYGLLFASHRPLEYLDHRSPEMSIHLQGMWVAFTIAAMLTALLVVKLSKAIELRDREVATMREREARSERIAAVATLAAGAAHELGTPLATIAVAAKELEHTIDGLPSVCGSRLTEDVELIRSELARCRDILNRLTASSGQTTGEAPIAITVRTLLDTITAAVPASHRSRLRVSTRSEDGAITLPRTALFQVAQTLLANALEAGTSPVLLSVDVSSQGLRLVVKDDGRGMSEDVLSRLGEPFFTTKRPGEGLGLGVFIARTLVEQMGGRFSIDSTLGTGTLVAVEIPDAPERDGNGAQHVT